MANFSSTYPSTRPVFNADFSNAGRLDSRITFSRSDTPPTYAAPSAVHYWSNEKHLSSDNLLLRSSTFNVTWSRQGLGTPTGGQADPAGGTDGFTLVEDSTTNFHRVYQNVTADGKPALTVYAKQNSGSRYLLLTLWNTTNDWECAVFDLAGSAPATASGASSTFTGVTATQTASGGGYYKCVLTGTGTANDWFISLNDTSTTSGINVNYGVKSYAGDGTSSIDVAFASLTTTGATDYNATTTQIHREYAPTLKSVSYAGQPRFEYSPTDSASEAIGQSRGLLIEGSATNLIPNSSAINSWATVGDVTITDSAAVGPDGTLSASLVRPTTVNSYLHYVRETITTVASSSYTFSAYVKPAGYTKVQLFFYQTSSPYTTGAETIFTLTGSGSASTAVGSSTITAVGGGYYRISVTGVAGTTATFAAIRLLDDSGSNEFTGDGYSGILCTGVQFEQNSFPSSLISTNGSQVTRAADSASMVDANLFDNGGGSMIVECENVGRGYYAATLSDGSSGNYKDWVSLIVQDNDTVRQAVNAPDSTSSSNLYSSASTVGGSYFKVGSRFAPNNFGVCIDGGTVSTDTTGAIPSNVDKLFIGWYQDGGRANAHIKRVAVYSEPLSDTNLQALTS